MKTWAGIDIGGTFTDVVAHADRGPILHAKLPSGATPGDSFRAALATLQRRGVRPDRLAYGTTAATNAVLQDALPRIGLLVTAGFRHILELHRPHDDRGEGAFGPRRTAAPFVPLEDVHEVDERLDAHGRVRRPVTEAAAAEVAAWCRARGLHTVAVCLLHSARNPEPERRLKARLEAEDPALRVVLSSDVLPESREYERASASCLTAALQPLLGDHVHEAARSVQESAPGCPVFVMQSSGGLQSVDGVGARPLATVLSGPAAVAVGAARLAPACSDLIAFDMGGTSTDISLVRRGSPLLTTRGRLGGYPIPTPMIDLTSIGAGGGSIARPGADARWHVGPHSAGADPGPACYGNRGSEPTVTDANLILGRLPAALLDGGLELSAEPARQALGRFGSARGKTAEETAGDVVRLVNHAMCGAIRHLCARRGLDPRATVLLAAGGAGPLHAAELASLLGVTRVIVPLRPGLAAAQGLLAADVRLDVSEAAPDAGLDPDEVGRALHALEERAANACGEIRIVAPEWRFARSGDFHYMDGTTKADTTTEIGIDLPSSNMIREALPDAIDRFHAAYERTCGFSFAGRKAVRLSRLSVTATGVLPKPPLPRVAKQAGRVTPVGRRPVFFFAPDGFVDCPIYRRLALGSGASLNGPAVVEQYDATTLVPPDWRAVVDDHGSLILSRGLAA